MAMVVATMARGMLMPLLRLPLMPSLATATDMVVSMVDMEDTDTERGRLRLLLMLSPAMATDTVVDTDMAATDTVVSMVDTDMVADTTDNFLSNSSFLYSNIHSCSKI